MGKAVSLVGPTFIPGQTEVIRTPGVIASEVEEQDSHLVCLLFTLWRFLCLVTFLIIGIFRMATIGSNLNFNAEPNTETVN